MTTVRTTTRWRGVVSVALLAGAAGVLLKRPSLLLLSAVGVALTVYPRLTRPPTVSLDIERATDADEPADGDPVAVTVTVHNTGESTLTDCRIVDGVPPMLSVVEGTPRHTAVLRPGASTTFSYTVRATRGVHRFEAASVIARDIAGANEVETTVGTDTSLACESSVPAVPLRRQTGQRVGNLVTDEGGSGIEFHRTRDYREGDPLSRVDWRRFARTGELATAEYREERATSVVLCLDGREAAYRTRAPGEPHAVSHCLGAIEQTFGALVETANQVGLAGFGTDFCWLPPGAGTEQTARGRNLLASHPTLSVHRPGEPTTAETLFEQVAELRKRLRGDTQVVLFSPLPDDAIAEACLRLEANGHAVTVISPDVTNDESTGGRLAEFERSRRLDSLRESGVRTVEWTPDQPYGAALVRAQGRWSA
ncbi:DUF58 domain-containing protein [Haloarcula amylovorans]|uniref:DUF58 domain-containing protein n=1 Tax=Haloarcula amylovorans TaxID=2562280 RepID=UPI001075FFF9|nr:DUF58 domain-containing protein [Halomicroarcula amylolytica]